jgi:pyroglutamyl-peptidase
MSETILITSFTTWESHQLSNASDDLLELFSATSPPSMHFLRRLPVDFQLAPQQIITTFVELQPDVTILCGMAEERDKLHLESSAVLEGRIIQTRVDLKLLSKDLRITEISHDAGRFVCNETYFRVLSHMQENKLRNHCVFVHVPPLTEANGESVLQDFGEIVRRMSMRWQHMKATEEELPKFVRSHLADYKLPQEIEILDTLPRGATDKIDRKKLRESTRFSD